MSPVVFLSSDLMFSSRVKEAARPLQLEVMLIADPVQLADKLNADCRLVLIDLSLDHLNLPSAVRAARASSPQAKIIAYGAHVDHAVLTDAAEAGCDQVFTRGQFNQQYAALLRAAAQT